VPTVWPGVVWESSAAVVLLRGLAERVDDRRVGRSATLPSSWVLVQDPELSHDVSDSTSNTILRFNGSTGASMGVFVSAGSGGLRTPTATAFGPDGNLYVSSTTTRDVKEYNGANGAFIREFTSGGRSYNRM